MSKDETQQLKGIAIMMMLWLHLFGTSREILDHCQTFIYLWNGDPLIYAMRKLGRMCIVFYTFLGGYGLYKVYVNSIISAAGRQVASTHGPRRALRLLKHYWIVLALFLLVAIPLFPKTYPGGWMALILNITSIDCTYNDGLVRRYNAIDGGLISAEQGPAPDPNLYQIYETEDYRVEFPFRETPEVHDRASGKLLYRLDLDGIVSDVDTDMVEIIRGLKFKHQSPGRRQGSGE